MEVEEELWLIGKLSQDLNEQLTPTNRQILQVYFFKQIIKKEKKSKILSELIGGVKFQCERLGLITLSESTIRKNILKLLEEYKLF
jgi:hypothetical protein